MSGYLPGPNFQRGATRILAGGWVQGCPCPCGDCDALVVMSSKSAVAFGVLTPMETRRDPGNAAVFHLLGWAASAALMLGMSLALGYIGVAVAVAMIGTLRSWANLWAQWPARKPNRLHSWDIEDFRRAKVEQ